MKRYLIVVVDAAQSRDAQSDFRSMDWTQTLKRADALEVNELPDGYVIYQGQTDRVHYLNGTAVLVFELCDGQHSAGQIPQLIQSMFELASPPTNEVEQCLTRFLDEGLVLTA